jgi:hypothetical protein
LKDFDKELFKKTASPFKKWAYTEALACFLKTVDEDLDQWMGEYLPLNLLGISTPNII